MPETRGRKPEPREPGELTRLPAPPKTLKETGKAKWKSIGQQMIAMEILDVIDLHALEELCKAYDQEAAGQEIVDTEGYSVQGEKGPYTNPAVYVVNNARAQIRAYISMLGLNRKTRKGIGPTTTAKKQTVSARKR